MTVAAGDEEHAAGLIAASESAGTAAQAIEQGNVSDTIVNADATVNEFN